MLILARLASELKVTPTQQMLLFSKNFAKNVFLFIKNIEYSLLDHKIVQKCINYTFFYKNQPISQFEKIKLYTFKSRQNFYFDLSLLSASQKNSYPHCQTPSKTWFSKQNDFEEKPWYNISYSIFL